MLAEGNGSQKEPQKKRNPLLLVGGLFVLGIALAMLLFGNQLFEGRQGKEAVVFEQVPASGFVNREGVPLPDRGAPLNVGDVAHNFSLPDLDGKQVALSEFQGKPVIINFWATWCPPCRLEMPEFQRAYETYEEDDLVILAVNEAEQSEVVSSFFYDQMGYTYTPLLDEEGQVAEAYGAIGLPSTFFVDDAGEVTAVHRGLLTKGQLEEYLELTIPLE
ncbi:MAG: redoxin domain-containing protein [Chloroflexi bacterium]|jgi:peroxiredoxin|nr:redoxin domain-containing protein [Chloroflexota bacterium]